jgi:hypothetical protein
VVAAATDGGDADSGFTLQWSSNGSTWITLDTFSQGQPAGERGYDLGGLTGTIQVRFMDNNRARGERSHDSISVDLIELEGGGDIPEPEDATQAMITSFTISAPGASRGQSYARATIQLSDNLGQPIDGATITVVFSGSISESVPAITNWNGTATATTSMSARKPTVLACVSNVSGTALSYEAGTEGC